jgi:hypothetical protein
MRVVWRNRYGQRRSACRVPRTARSAPRRAATIARSWLIGSEAAHGASRLA